MKKILLIFFLIPFFLFAQSGYVEPWGKDFDLKYQPEKKENKQKPSILTKAANQVILFHQNYISPTTGPRSSFRPTSSKYMQLAMQRYGFFKGFIMGCDRLLRENKEPWVYKKIIIDNIEYKYDPAINKKYITLR